VFHLLTLPDWHSQIALVCYPRFIRAGFCKGFLLPERASGAKEQLTKKPPANVKTPLEDRKMKKLLVITDMYPDSENPIAGIFVQQQVEALLPFYHVRVLASYFPAKPRVAESTDRGYILTYIYFKQRPFFPLMVATYRENVLPNLEKIIADWQPDLIHVHDCRHLPELFALSSALKSFPGRKLLTVHNVKTLPEKAETWYLKLIYHSTLRQAYSPWHHVFCVNDRLRQRLKSYVALERSSNIGNAVAEAEDQEVPESLVQWLKADSFKIISVGNLIRSKGFDLLLRAVYELDWQGFDLQVMIVGNGSEQERLQELINRLKLQSVVKLQPALPNAILRNLYCHFDAFVLPSYSETFGIVYLEAMNAGLPVIGVRGQGIDGIVEEGISGLLALPQDVSDLTAKIGWLLRNPTAAKELGKQGKILVESRFRLGQLICKLREQYEA